MISEIEVHSAFFPEALREALVHDLDQSRERKREFVLYDVSTPDCVKTAAAYTSSRLGLTFNLAILKRYRIADSHESGAYEAHRDPERLASIPLVLTTLRGEADLYYWSEDGEEHVVRCVKNMLILLNARLLHRVTPPLSALNERDLLFLGFDATVG